jgi:23S rRNA pseudouridine1911/1915/1917 synthase
MPRSSSFTILIEAPDAGRRLDVLVASLFADCSRSAAAGLIRDKNIRVNGKTQKPGYRVRLGDEICGSIPPSDPLTYGPEAIDLDILFEDEDIIVVNKPPGMVVHPAPGHYTGTLVNGLLHHCPDLYGIGDGLRPGIVHRLDKDTSGVLVVAKNAGAYRRLSLQFKSRQIKKTYIALVYGTMTTDTGSICLPIGRHPVRRKKMSTVGRKTRRAETSWRVRERFSLTTLLEIDLKTGRTHQIRVHCAAIHHPIVGDAVYGGRRVRKIGASLRSVRRQMLHAWRIGFIHPKSQAAVSFTAPIAHDLAHVVAELRKEQPYSSQIY